MKTFVLGDIHGAHKALVQCLERCGFDKEQDLLITLGDICDGWPYVYECVEELLTIKNRIDIIDIIGNHDEWFTQWLLTGIHADPCGPWAQGGRGTARSYLRQIDKEHLFERSFSGRGYTTALNAGDIPDTHRQFFEKQILYYIDEKMAACFVHAGFYRGKAISYTASMAPAVLYWDRELWKKALNCKGTQKIKTADGFWVIFIGHTTCYKLNEGRPVNAGGVWNLDTGAGWEGKLTIMNVDTKDFWQSDLVEELYPEDTSRRSYY